MKLLRDWSTKVCGSSHDADALRSRSGHGMAQGVESLGWFVRHSYLASQPVLLTIRILSNENQSMRSTCCSH